MYPYDRQIGLFPQGSGVKMCENKKIFETTSQGVFSIVKMIFLLIYLKDFLERRIQLLTFRELYVICILHTWAYVYNTCLYVIPKKQTNSDLS